MPSPTFARLFVCAVLASSGAPVRARAQRDPRGDAPSGASSPNEVAQPEEPASDDDEVLGSATPDPAPPVPMILQRPPSESPPDVVEQAGVGGPLAYASASVLEVGGSGSLLTTGDQTMLRFAPFVGWFVYDGIRLACTHEVYAMNDEGQGRVATAILVGASAHVRINDRFLMSAGSDLGPLYNGAAWGFLVRPSLGLDVLVGRSAIFHPTIALTWSNRDLVDLAGGALGGDRLAFGLDLAYSAMF